MMGLNESYICIMARVLISEDGKTLVMVVEVFANTSNLSVMVARIRHVIRQRCEDGDAT